MMIYKPFVVVVVPFPFTESQHAKKRPALVLSSEEHQRQTSHITLSMITSAKHSHWYDDHRIMDLDMAGLKSDSIIRQKIFTLDIHLIIDCIGKLSVQDKEAVTPLFLKHLKVLCPI
jgi:mRNA interferase MazF